MSDRGLGATRLLQRTRRKVFLLLVWIRYLVRYNGYIDGQSQRLNSHHLCKMCRRLPLLSVYYAPYCGRPRCNYMTNHIVSGCCGRYRPSHQHDR
ncbi:hypothetical protein BJV82DRAFT_632622 [Fennellomyces sp. T-0311]|nr:hypothetical protein BJV82DRAFT_632622 [Fennellomyces sp. T-0311]